MNVNQAINIDDLRKMAKRRLPRIIYDFIEGGVEDELGIARNEAAYDRERLVPHYLVDVSQRDQTVDLFDRRYVESLRNFGDRTSRIVSTRRRPDARRVGGAGQYSLHDVRIEHGFDQAAAKSRRVTRGINYTSRAIVKSPSTSSGACAKPALVHSC